MEKVREKVLFCTAGSTEGSDRKAGSDRDGDESIFGGWACDGGGYSGTWQDDHGDCFFQSDRTAEAQSAVYTGCTSVRSDGFTIYQKERNAFVYHPGAWSATCFWQMRSTGRLRRRSQPFGSDGRGQVTVDGKTRKIAPPFLVIATENPSGSAGTQLLPESQLDRFMVCVKMGYPTIREEMEILRKNENGRTSDAVQQVMTKEELEEAQRETAQIFMHERILEYLVQLAQATREHEMLELGMSPRGTVALAKMAKAGAYLAGREYVVPADVRGVFRETAQHRILLNTRARISKVKQKEVLQEILSAVESPSLKKR